MIKNTTKKALRFSAVPQGLLQSRIKGFRIKPKTNSVWGSSSSGPDRHNITKDCVLMTWLSEENQGAYLTVFPIMNFFCCSLSFLVFQALPVFLVLARAVILNFKEPLKNKWITDNSNSIFYRWVSWFISVIPLLERN